MEFVEVSASSPAKLKERVVKLLIEEMIIVKGRSADCPSYTSLEEHVMKAMELILDRHSPSHLFSLVDDNVPVSVCLANLACGVESGGWYLWINEIYVASEKRTKGIGKKMATSVVEWAKERGCRYVAGITWKENEASQKLFKSCGFSAEEVIWLDKEL